MGRPILGTSSWLAIHATGIVVIVNVCIAVPTQMRAFCSRQDNSQAAKQLGN
jgi:hypothetical protein